MSRELLVSQCSRDMSRISDLATDWEETVRKIALQQGSNSFEGGRAIVKTKRIRRGSSRGGKSARECLALNT